MGMSGREDDMFWNPVYIEIRSTSLVIAGRSGPPHPMKVHSQVPTLTFGNEGQSETTSVKIAFLPKEPILSRK